MLKDKKREGERRGVCGWGGLKKKERGSERETELCTLLSERDQRREGDLERHHRCRREGKRETEELQNDSSNHPPTSDALLLFARILPSLSSHPSLPYLMGAHAVTAGRLTGHLLGLEGGRKKRWGGGERKKRERVNSLK